MLEQLFSVAALFYYELPAPESSEIRFCLRVIPERGHNRICEGNLVAPSEAADVLQQQDLSPLSLDPK